MFYKVHRVVVGIIMRIFFRKIYIDGLENLPRDKPMFLVSNHPNGFWEPCVYACTFPFQLHFLVRGDLFKKKAFSWFLYNTNQIPIFRFRDGFKNLRENAGSRSVITQKLQQNARIMVFGEGSSDTVKYLRPLQKGMARMAYDAYQENSDLDIKVVPLGITFNEPDGFRKNVMIKIGEAINFNDYLPQFEENEGLAKKKITQDTYEAIKPLLLNVYPEIEDLYEVAAPIVRTELGEQWMPIVEKSTKNFDAEAQLVKQLNEHVAKEEIEKYGQCLTEMNTQDKYVGGKKSILVSFILGIIMMPFAMVGFVLNWFPSGITFLMAAYVIPRNKFYGSLSGLSRLGLHWYVLYPIITIVCVSLWGWIGLLYVPLAFTTEWIFYRWWDQLVFIFHKLKLSILHKQTLATAKDLRTAILNRLNLNL